MYSRESAEQRMEPWETSSLTEYSCEDFPSFSKPSSTEKKQNEAK